MKLGAVVERIRFGTATASDITGRSANQQFANSAILQQLRFSLDEFAKKTKYFEYILSQSVEVTQNFVDYPPRALRTGSIHGVHYYLNTLRYQLSVQNTANTYNHYQINNYSGVPAYAYPYGSWDEQKIELFPRPQQGANTTTLSLPYKAGDTTITTASVAGFLIYKGRITIGDTKFEYKRIVDGVLTEVSVVEETTDQNYGAGETVTSNNLWILYYGLHEEFPLIYNNISDILDVEIKVAGEYIETIIDYVIYKLLLKIDIDRATNYKIDWEKFLRDAEYEIAAGRGNERKNGAKRSTGLWEAGYPNLVG